MDTKNKFIDKIIKKKEPEQLSEEQINSLQLVIMKKQLNHLRFISAFLIIMVTVILVGAIIIIPIISDTLNSVNALIAEVTGVFTNVNGVLEDVQAVIGTMEGSIEQFAGIDFAPIIEEIEGVVADSRGAIAAALESFDSIDFDGLNNAIGDLEAIISPLASLLGR